MFSFVRRLHSGEAVDSPAPVTPGFVAPKLASIDAMDAVEVPQDLPESPLKGQGFIIEYEDAEGFLSERRVRASSVFAAGPHIYLSAYCFERKAPRQFRIDRIASVSCATHGNDLGDPNALFVPTSVRPALGANLKRAPMEHRDIRLTLRALMTIARSDGHLHPAEGEVMAAYVAEVLPPGTPPETVDDLIKYAANLVADFAEFQDGTNVALNSERLARPFLLSAAALAAADGELASSERALLEDLAWIASYHGIDVTAL